MSQNIGFIGLGIMGLPMCQNLIKAGFKVTAWNRTTSKIEPIVKAGGTSVSSPKEVAEHADIIITIVTNTPDVKDVIFGNNGIIHSAKPGTIVIDMSTISPEVTKDMAKQLQDKNIEMLDAPVSGGDSGAIAGTLAIMVGGKKEIFDRCSSIFEAMGKTITHVGSNGMGQTVKLCNQILVSITNLAVCEAITFANKSGLDPKTMIEATKNGAAGSWQLSNLGSKMVDRDFDPGFMINLQQKDLMLALDSAKEMNLALPGLAYVHQLFSSCQGRHEGTQGTQALIKSLEKLNNII